jgi:hypothetical protein
MGPACRQNLFAPFSALARVLEGEAGASPEILYGARHEHSAWCGDRRDSRADVDRHAPKAVVDANPLTGMHTDTGSIRSRGCPIHPDGGLTRPGA